MQRDPTGRFHTNNGYRRQEAAAELRGKIAFGLLCVLVIIAAGTFGYHRISDWSWFDSFYMTIITLTTIGYGELPHMTRTARYFTVGLIVVGLTTVGYTLSLITQSLIQSEILSLFGRRKVFKAVGKLKNHFIICGAGRMGTRIAREMALNRAPFVVIERDPEAAERVLQQGHLVIQGDATDEETLKSAAIGHAQGIVCAVSSDAENVYTSLMARDLNPQIYIVARANEESAERKLIKAGANKVVCPTRIGSYQMAYTLLKPVVSDFIELTTMAGSEDLGMEAILISEGTDFVNTTLRDSGIRSQLDLIVVAIRRENGEMLFNPSGETIILAGDRLVAVGKRENLNRLEKRAGPTISGIGIIAET